MIGPGRLRPGSTARLAGLALLAAVLAAAVAPAPTPARAADSVEQRIEDLARDDPFVSLQAESELRRLEYDAFAPLIEASRSRRPEIRLTVDRILDDLLESFLLELESEYRSLDLDRRELEELRARQRAREEIARLESVVKRWKEEIPDLDSKAERFLTRLALQRRREELAPGEPPDPDLERKLAELTAEVEALKAAAPDLEKKVLELARYYQLKSLQPTLEERGEVEPLRIQELSERVAEREPRVERLVARVHQWGLPVYSAIAARRRVLPVSGPSEAGDLRPPVQILYEEILSEAMEKLPEDIWQPSAEEIGAVRYCAALLWAHEIDRRGPRAERARRLLDRHIDLTIGDLDSPEWAVRERAARELYRLETRGLDALLRKTGLEDAADFDPAAGPHAFLACLLRWRIDPRTYHRVGMHFGEYRQLSYAARRRKIFQYARAAGHDALPTLRAVVIDDSLEPSFLVKYAASKALESQAGDRLGYLVLKSLHPALVLKRPQISKDLRIIQGLAHVRSKRYAEAIEEFSRILEDAPFDFEGNYHTAFTYLLMKNFPKAVHYFEIARRIQPEDQLTLYNLACAYSLGGKQDQALEALEASVKAGFDDADHMEQDPDLDPLRNLPRFRKLIEELRAAQRSPR
ncbi:MAG: hypothetical protein JXA90_07315 [Planctomycetes bacterium]|nr:hypothetical protein [Planctomycetota bacterium]